MADARTSVADDGGGQLIEERGPLGEDLPWPGSGGCHRSRAAEARELFGAQPGFAAFAHLGPSALLGLVLAA